MTPIEQACTTTEQGGVGSRILQRIEALASLSQSPDKLTRLYLTPEHRQANDMVAGWMRAAGMEVREDEVGNLIGLHGHDAPDAPVLMIGSHLDTVRNAGKWDGMLGVVLGVECVEALRKADARLPFGLAVVAFGDEEGVRFQSALIGSRAVAGTLDPGTLDRADAEGVTMAEAMRRFGLDPVRAGDAAWPEGSILAYAEVHIEQGPVLEEAGLALGVVSSIAGASRYTVTIGGVAGHAGTVPMTMRRDALAAAADCVLAVERCCGGSDGLVGTVGRIEAAPGAVNVIAGQCRFTIDIRAPEDPLRRDAERRVLAAFEEISVRRRVTIDAQRTHDTPSCPCSIDLVRALTEALRAEGREALVLPSGAGHDAMAIAAVAPVGMLFVRCKGGISHNPAEAVSPADAEAASAALVRFVQTIRPELLPSLRATTGT
jgi:allantoate deiminase